MVHLILINPEFAQQGCDLPDGAWTVGRSRKNQIVIRDESVSSRHCELLVFGSEVIVREQSSRNGTFVDETRVKAQSGVRHGQRLRFGNVIARLEIHAPSDDGATSVTALHSYRRFVGQFPQEPSSPAVFPVIFVPSGSKPAASETDP